MEIEIKQPTGAYLNVVVKKITPESLLVAYKDEMSKPDEEVAYENCRVAKQASSEHQDFKIEDTVEAYIQKGELVGWQMAKVTDTKGQFAVVESLNEPKTVDIVNFDSCRDPSMTTPLTFECLKQFSIPVPEDMRSYFEQPDSFKDLYETIHNVLVEYDSEKGNIIFWSYSDATIRKVKILSDFFLCDSRQKMQFLQRNEHIKKLEKSSGAIVDSHIEEFEVMSDLMGLAIGSQGTNFARARHVEGIKEIVYQNSKFNEDYVTIKIVAENKEAAEQARSILEYVLLTVEIPRRMMSRIIGKNGATIQEIVDKAGVVRVQVEDEDHEAELVNFVFTGTKETVSNAELLIQFHLKHLKEMQEMREELNYNLAATGIHKYTAANQQNSNNNNVSPNLTNFFLESLKQAGSANRLLSGGRSGGNFVDFSNNQDSFRGRGRARGGRRGRFGGNRPSIGAHGDDGY